MKTLKQPGGMVYAVDAIDRDKQNEVRYCITPRQLGRLSKLRLSTKIAQFFGVVADGLILTRHVFVGLKRPMCTGEDMSADKTKLVYCWKPSSDALWYGGRFSQSFRKVDPPPSRVFVVYVSLNTMHDIFPGVDGWLEDWTWLPESTDKATMPAQYNTRYDNTLWSKDNEC